MKKLALLLALIAIIIGQSLLAQTKHQTRQMRVIEREIRLVSQSIHKEELLFFREVEKFGAPLDSLDFAEPVRLADLRERLVYLQETRNGMITEWVTEEIPLEMSKPIMKKRLRSNVVRREELLIDHLKNGDAQKDSNYDALKVILDNKTYQSASFHLFNEGNNKAYSFTVSGKEKQAHVVEPGSYLVKIYQDGSLKGSHRIKLTGEVKQYENEYCGKAIFIY